MTNSFWWEIDISQYKNNYSPKAKIRAWQKNILLSGLLNKMMPPGKWLQIVL